MKGSWLNQKPRIATEDEIKQYWGVELAS